MSLTVVWCSAIWMQRALAVEIGKPIGVEAFEHAPHFLRRLWKGRCGYRCGRHLRSAFPGMLWRAKEQFQQFGQRPPQTRRLIAAQFWQHFLLDLQVQRLLWHSIPCDCST